MESVSDSCANFARRHVGMPLIIPLTFDKIFKCNVIQFKTFENHQIQWPPALELGTEKKASLHLRIKKYNGFYSYFFPVNQSLIKPNKCWWHSFIENWNHHIDRPVTMTTCCDTSERYNWYLPHARWIYHVLHRTKVWYFINIFIEIIISICSQTLWLF